MWSKDGLIGFLRSFLFHPSHFSEIIIGYDRTVYSVAEFAGFVNLTARVLQGKLRNTISVTASTVPDSATGSSAENIIGKHCTI